MAEQGGLSTTTSEEHPMDAIPFSVARKHLNETMERVVRDRVPVTRRPPAR